MTNINLYIIYKVMNDDTFYTFYVVTENEPFNILY